jgi:hypothetical protein
VALPATSNVDFLGDRDCIVDFDAEISDGTLDLRINVIDVEGHDITAA